MPYYAIVVPYEVDFKPYSKDTVLVPCKEDC